MRELFARQLYWIITGLQTGYSVSCPIDVDHFHSMFLEPLAIGSASDGTNKGPTFSLHILFSRPSIRRGIQHSTVYLIYSIDLIRIGIRYHGRSYFIPLPMVLIFSDGKVHDRIVW
jgi:hypothetical protein